MSEIKIEAVCSNPNDVELSLTITATLKEWNRLRETMGRDSYCELKSNLNTQIIDLVLQFSEAKYMPKTEETNNVTR